MANIAINNYCNLQCPYCFANRYITEEDVSSISIEQLNSILLFLGKTNPGRIGLIGGEPTLHPEIDAILRVVTEFCQEHGSRWSLFSNGIHLGKLARHFDTTVAGCLINVNHPDVVGDQNWKKIESSISRIKLRGNLDKLSIGINLYPNIPDFSFIFNLAEKYGFNSVRTSYVAPTCQFEGLNKDEYYLNAKPLFLSFVREAKSRGISVRLDCNHIPHCYFSKDERELIEGVVLNFKSFCKPVIDITPDFKATACFGAYDLVELKDFDNLYEVERYLYREKMAPLAIANGVGKCASCLQHQESSCQGGCLAFARHKEG